MLILQLPVFIALYGVVRLITGDPTNIAKYTYSFLQGIPFVHDLVHNPHHFNDSLLGLVNLSRHALEPAGVYWPILALAMLAGVLQFIQSRQLLPQVKEGRKLRDMLKEQASGKKIDQSEMSALMSNRMVYLFPLLTFFISIYLAGALVLYLATTSAVAIFQQSMVLREDTEELEAIGEKSGNATQKLKNAKEAEVVAVPKKSAKAKKRRKK